ncbi:MAG TPA: hypothetical protein VJO35_01640 [Terriglobales bacterium]|nr:hypothetical protein [Terriglobales bacterium]
MLIDRAQSLRRNVRDLDIAVVKAAQPARVKQQLRLRDEALEALRQSLHDLESLRMVKSDEPAISELKADIRKTLQSAR